MKDKTILIQGAMDIEIEYFIDKLEKKEKQTIAGYEFYTGYIHTSKIIISKTLVGVVNSTTATTIGIMTFHPDFVINQGIAGAHKSNIHIGDIIIGEKCCNINAFSMPTKEEGHSSNPFEWETNKRGEEIQNGDKKLVKIRKKYGKIDPFNFWEPIEINVEGIGTVKILKIIDIGSMVQVDSSDTNRLIEE